MQCSQLTKIGCGIIIKNQDQILFGKRKGSYGAGTWALPGGHLEYQEKLIDAAKRELKEELDIHADDLRIVAISDDLGQRHYIHVTFLLNGYEGPIKLVEPDKCEEWKFFSIHDLPQPLFHPHQKILQTFLSQEVYMA